MLTSSSRLQPGHPNRLPLLPAILLAAAAQGQPAELPPDLIELTPDSIRESMIAFVNLSTAPGLDGATFQVDTSVRESDLIRGSLGYTADLTLKDYIFDGYWGLALTYGRSDDTVRVRDADGKALELDSERDILSFRSSGGFNFPFHQHFSVRSYLSMAVSQLETDTQVTGLGEQTILPLLELDSAVDALTTSGTVVARYDRWFDSDRVELSAQYTAAYTDTFNGSDEALDTWGWNETTLLRAAYSWDSGYRSNGRPWRWRAYGSHTQFHGLNNDALGFTYYTELGMGLDYEWNIRPLDWFGLRFIGFKLGFIFGNDVEGFSAGLSF